MEFQYYGNYDRPPTRRILDQPWWEEEDTLSDRRINGKITTVFQLFETIKKIT